MSATRDIELGGVTLLGGADNGRYPDGNAFVVTGPDQTLLVDGSLTARARALAGDLAHVDQIVISHAHEDHLAALSALPGLPVWAHRDDRNGVASMEGLLAVYGYTGTLAAEWSEQLQREFFLEERRDGAVAAFDDGHTFDLGGGRTAMVLHLPGHTRGHCGLLVEPDGFCYVADVDLTGFGPYYGDAWSDLDAFESTLRRCAELDARWFLTFHQKGLIESTAAFRVQLAAFGEVIARRDAALLAFFAEPHTLDDVVAHRFVYRPHVEGVYIDTVERRMGAMHLRRLAAQGRVVETEPGRYRAA